MDLKDTKATRARSTAKPFERADPVPTTARALRGLKNFYLGEKSEDIALDHYLKRGFTCQARRWKSPFAEVDLVLISPEKKIYLIEVKRLSSFEFLSHRLSAKQKRRLQRAHLYCCEAWGEVVLELAVVSQQGEVLIIENVFG